MNLYERLFPNPEGRLESFWHKAVRHVLTGDFHPKTLRRGLDNFRHHQETKKLEGFGFQKERVVRCYQNHKDITYTTYQVRAFDRNSREYKDFSEGAQFYDFSADCELFFKFTYPNVGIDKALLTTPSAIAEVVGPTTHFSGTADYSFLPNNGFYLHTNPQDIPFEKFKHTNPFGQRRGALTQTTDGKIIFEEENSKWDRISQGFPDTEVMIGTSFYYLSSDTGEEEDYGAERDEMHQRVSCFIEAEYPIGPGEETEKRYSYVTLHHLSNRNNMKEILDEHFLRNLQAKSYMALEMDFAGSGVLTRNNQNNTLNPNPRITLFNDRVDHWMIRPKKPS